MKHHYENCSVQCWHMFYEKRGLLDSEIPDLGVYTIKTPLIGRISIFLVPKNRPIRGLPVVDKTRQAN